MQDFSCRCVFYWFYFSRGKCNTIPLVIREVAGRGRTNVLERTRQMSVHLRYYFLQTPLYFHSPDQPFSILLTIARLSRDLSCPWRSNTRSPMKDILDISIIYCQWCKSRRIRDSSILALRCAVKSRQKVEIFSLTILDDPNGSSGMTGRNRS